MQQNTHSKQPIKAIVFDLDGVYFDKGKNEFLDALSRYDVDRVSAETVFLQSQQMADYKLGNIGDGDFWSWAESQWKTGLSNQELVELMLKDYTIDGRVATLAKTVRKSGYKTLICSNNFPARVEGLEKKFGFLQDFDTAVFSYQIHAAKPSVEIFSELLHRSSCQPHEIVYADDKSSSLGGAKKLGIRTLLYTDFDTYCKDLQSMGVVNSCFQICN